MAGRGIVVGFVAFVAVVAGCSGDDGEAAPEASTSSTEGTTAPARPAVDLTGITVSDPVVGGATGAPQNAAPQDLAAAGYVEEEFFVSGTATAYRAAGDLGRDGRWVAEAADTSPSLEAISIVRKPGYRSRKR